VLLDTLVLETLVLLETLLETVDELELEALVLWDWLPVLDELMLEEVALETVPVEVADELEPEEEPEEAVLPDWLAVPVEAVDKLELESPVL